MLNNDGFDVTTDVAIVTARPTLSPSFTTTIPSASPSVTGIVVTLTLSRTDELLNVTEIENLESSLADQYGITRDDVTVDVSYIVNGVIQIDEIRAPPPQII